MRASPLRLAAGFPVALGFALLAAGCGPECRYDADCPSDQRCTPEGSCTRLGGGSRPDAGPRPDAGRPDTGPADAGTDQDTGTPDTGPGPLPMTLACASTPLPTTVAEGATEATVTGRAVAIDGTTPVAGATVAAFAPGSDAPAAMATTDTDGNFRLAIPLTAGAPPFEGRLRISASGRRDTEYVLTAPLDGSGPLDVGGLLVATDEDWTNFSGTYGQSPARALGFVFPIDCAGSQLGGVPVRTDQGPPLVIFYPTMDAPTATDPSPEAEKVYLINAPPDAAMAVTVDFGSGVSRTVSVTLRAGVVTYLPITPHGALADSSGAPGP